MSNPKPFTENERKAVLRYVGSLALNHPDRAMGYAQDSLRWDATIAQVEAERDALREEVEGAYEAHAALALERDVLKDELADAKADRESWRHIALHV